MKRIIPCCGFPSEYYNVRAGASPIVDIGDEAGRSLVPVIGPNRISAISNHEYGQWSFSEYLLKYKLYIEIVMRQMLYIETFFHLAFESYFLAALDMPLLLFGV